MRSTRTPFLLLSACLPALAQVVVAPRYPTVTAKAKLTLKALVDEKDDPTVTWSFPGRPDLQAPGGKFTAPVVQEATILPVVATKGGRSGEGAVLVLPDSATARNLVQVLRAGLDAQWSNRLPFLDVENPGTRFGEPAQVEVLPGYMTSRPILLGYGIPGPVSWSWELATADALLLTWRDGRDFERREVTGQHSAELTLRDLPQACQVEGLWRMPRTDGTVAWQSKTQLLDLQIRGVVPFAGNTVAEAGHEDGQGISSRFRAPCGVTLWKRDKDQPEVFAVADPADQTLRLVTMEGAATTLCGRAGEAGCQDGEGAAARLDGPTFVVSPWDALYLQRKGPGDLVVADSGNQVLRRVDAQGRVTTWAGRPGSKGYKDAANPREAEFNDPRGLAYDLYGNLYVADHGNHVIRRISPGGVVETLAGKAGEAGAKDGAGPAARFTDLKGLAYIRPMGAYLLGDLLVADGHAIRKVRVETGQVTTLAGQVDGPGFKDGEVQPGKPCLNDPWGLDVTEDQLLIAARGNHAIRTLTLHGVEPRLATLAGDPGAPATRWGLLRDGLPDVLPPDYAALEAPMAVAYVPGWLDHKPDHILVSTGRCLGLLVHPERTTHFEPSLDLEDGLAVKAGQPVKVTYHGMAIPRFREGGQVVPHAFTFHFLDPATLQEVHAPIHGQHLHGHAHGVAKVVFEHPGKVEVVLRCVTATGATCSDRRTLLVTPP